MDSWLAGANLGMGLHKHDKQSPKQTTYYHTRHTFLNNHTMMVLSFFSFLPFSPVASLASLKAYIIFCWGGVVKEIKHYTSRMETILIIMARIIRQIRQKVDIETEKLSSITPNTFDMDSQILILNSKKY